MTTTTTTIIMMMPTLTMMRSWLSAVKKCLSVGRSGPASFLQASWGRGLPELWHSSTAVSPTATTLSTIGFTKRGTSSTFRLMLVVMAPASFLAVQV